MKFKSIKSSLIFFITMLLGIISLFIFFYFPSQFEKLEVKSLFDKATVLNKMSAFSISPALNFNDSYNINEVASGIIRNRDIMYFIVEGESDSIKYTFNKSLAFSNKYKIIDNKPEPGKDLIYKTLEKVVYRNKTVGNIYDFMYAVQDYKAGDKVNIVVQRDGKEMTFNVELIAR